MHGNSRLAAALGREVSALRGQSLTDLARDRHRWHDALTDVVAGTGRTDIPVHLAGRSYLATLEPCDINPEGIAALLMLAPPRPTEDVTTSAGLWGDAAFRTVLDSLTSGVLVSNTQGEFIYYNRAAIAMMEPEPSPDGSFVVKPWVEPFGFFVPHTGERVAHDELPLMRALRGETVLSVPLVARTPSRRDGFTIMVSTRPLHDPSGARLGALAVFDDLTDTLTADRERRQLEDRVHESQRFESLAVLAGGIAHDFNNLLVGVLGNADTAAAMLPTDSPAQHPIAHVSKAALRAADLARQMLAYAGEGRFTIEPIDLSTLVREMADLMQAALPKAVRLRLELAPNLPYTQGDVTQLRQVVMNLLTNAGDACRERSGTIVVRTGAQEHSAAWLKTTYGAEIDPGYYLLLEVDDDGDGMDTETRRRIFDPFFTTKSKGRGLGLASALGIIRSLRGAIRVQSEPGRGTRFRVLLPAKGPRPRHQSGPLPAIDDDWRPQGTILVVDDEPLVRRATRRMLTSMGFTVAEAADGSEALSWLDQHPRVARAVLLDMTMPGMSGPEVFEGIAARAPELPVVMTSGREERVVLERLLDQGLAAFLPKPYRMAQLRAQLQDLLDANRPTA